RSGGVQCSRPRRGPLMTSIDRVLIDPGQRELFAALHEAIAAVNRDTPGQRSLPCTAEQALGELLTAMPSAEGAREWRVPGPGPNGVRAMLLAVWWRDFLERPHVRLLGGSASRGMPMPLPLPSPHRPALSCIYPDVCAVAVQHRRPR